MLQKTIHLVDHKRRKSRETHGILTLLVIWETQIKTTTQILEQTQDKNGLTIQRADKDAIGAAGTHILCWRECKTG